MMKQLLYTLLLLFCSICINTNSYAQCSINAPLNPTINCGDNHTLTTISSPIYQITNTTCGMITLPAPITPPEFPCDDCYTAPVNIGFPFNFYGNTYSTAIIQSNGMVGFGSFAFAGFTPFPLPNPTNPNNYIAGILTDIDIRNGGSINYQTIGVAPNRRFVVSYNAVHSYGGLGSATFQIVINENNTFQIIIGELTADWNYTTASSGVENADGSYAAAVPGRNASDFRGITFADQDCNTFGTQSCTFVKWSVGGIEVDTNTTLTVSPTVTTTYTAEWLCGDTPCTTTTTITVVDNVNPTITAPINVSVNADIGLCTASSVLLGTAAGTDNCGTPIFTNNAPLNFPIGTTTVVWTATDPNGNTATANQTITVIDTQLPTLTALSNVSRNADSGVCTFTNALSSIPNGVATDNCSIASYEYVLTGQTTGTVSTLLNQVFNSGITTVTWTATDTNGNISTSSSFTVTVNPTREIDVLGNSVSIIDGDITPNTADNTDFGFVFNNDTLTYTVSNLGIEALSITSITSDNIEFAIANAPTTAAAGSTATFDVVFTPTTFSAQTAIITINNDDCDEAVYDFVVQGQKIIPPTPTPTPSSPRNFTATTISTTQINLSWESVRNVTSYKLYRNNVLIATLPSNIVSYEDIELSSDTFYSYHIIAIKQQLGSITRSTPIHANARTFPKAPVLISQTDVCEGGNSLVKVSSSGVLYRIYSDSVGGAILAESTNAAIVFPSLNESTTLYVSVFSNNQESDRTAILVNVQEAFTASILGENEQISCDNTLDLQADSVENATYTWYRNGYNLGLHNQTITANHSGNYEVLVQKGVCSFMSAKVLVKLNQSPVAQIQEANGIKFCDNGILNAISTEQNLTYEWLLNNVTIGNSQTLNVAESGVYTLQITNQHGCQANNEIEIFVTNTPTIPILESNDVTICPDTETTISIQNIENGMTYQWFRNGRDLRQTGSSISTSIQGSYQVRVLSDQNNLCSVFSEELEINHFEVLPIYLRISEDKKSLFLEDINLSQNEIVNVEWYLNGELNTSLGSNFEITPTENGSYSAKVTNPNGCIIQTRRVYFSVPSIIVTGEDDIKSDIFKIYPNPSKGIFKVQFPVVLTENVEISIFDTTGKIIKTQFFEKNNQEFIIDIQDVAQGMYLIRFNQNDVVYSKSIILE